MKAVLEVITLLVLVLYVTINAQRQAFREKPQRCWGTDELMSTNCCIFTPFFARDIAQKCGVVTKVNKFHTESNVTDLRRFSITCNGWICILDKYHLLRQDTMEEYLDQEKFLRHLDRWTQLNPEFKVPMFKARTVCNELFHWLMPLKICHLFGEYHRCIRKFIKLNCPMRLNTPLCNKQKKFFDECREYLLK